MNTKLTSLSLTYSLLTLAITVISSIASADVSTPAVDLPVVSVDDFTVGKTWIWDYFESDGSIYSTERYEVLAVQGSVVLLELSSDYGGGQNLKPNHRLQVDVSQCLRAYRNPVQKQPWKFTMLYLSSGKWTAIEQTNTLGFEEKFNCNPREYLSASAPYLTVYGERNGEPVFQQKLWRRINGSWFGLTGEHRAIAIAHDFETGQAASYSFKLR